ncbi:MAG: hypothetical protein WEA31_07170 [Pirellulales bacterium]
MAHHTEYEVDREQLDRYLMDLDDQQNFGTAIVGGISWAIVGASMWTMATVLTGTPASYMAIPLGFLVGHGIRLTGRGLRSRFSVLGVVLVIVGCLVGHGMAATLLQVQMNRAELWSQLGAMFINPLNIASRVGTYFHPIDLLFYGLAIYQGSCFSLKRIREEDLIRFVRPVRRASRI